jgi:hypothetical protein
MTSHLSKLLCSLVFILLPAGSGCTLSQQPEPASPLPLQRPAQQSQAGPDKEALHLKAVNLQDRNNVGIGGDAFRMLVPAGWKIHGGVVWRHDLSVLATLSMRITNPDGSEALEFFPITPYAWNPSGVGFGFGTGSNYLGNIVLQPLDASSYLQQVFLPQYRRQLNVQIVQQETLPKVAQAVAMSLQEKGYDTVRAERPRLEYQEAGKWMQEDLFYVLAYGHFPTGIFWSADRLYSFKAPKGQLDKRAVLFQAVVSSLEVNPSWFNKYLQVAGMWQQNVMDSIRNAGLLSRYIAQTYGEISAINRQAWENYQTSSNRINRQFSEHIRGVETYHNVIEGRPVELPSGHREVWANPNGEYILSNNANFNPNVGSVQTWQRLGQAR